MLAHDYSSAVSEMLLKGNDPEVVLTRLKKILTTKGHLKLYPKILAHIETMLSKSMEQNTTTVVLGREKDTAALQSSIANTLQTFGGSDTYSTEIDPTIIGGFKVKQRNKVLDKSYKSKLVTLYRSIIE